MSTRSQREAAKVANLRITSSPGKPAAKTAKKKKKPAKKSTVPKMSEATAAAIRRGYEEIGEETAPLTMRAHKAAGQVQEYRHTLVLSGREINLMHSKKSTKELPATFHTDEWYLEDAPTVALLYALRKRTGHMARNSEMLAEKLGAALEKIDRLEAAAAAVTNDPPLHHLVRRNDTSDFFYVPYNNIREFQVHGGGPLLKLTLDDQVGDAFKEIRLLTLYAVGGKGSSPEDLLATPDEFIYADPVRRVLWVRHDAKWVAEPLKSDLRGNSDLRDLFDKDWLPGDINGPYPFDPSLEIKVSGEDDIWQIHDAAGGVVFERDEMLVYEKGGTTISISIKSMDSVANFAEFSHDVIKVATPDEKEQQATCNRCGGSAASFALAGICGDCVMRALAAHNVKNEVAAKAKAVEAKAVEAKAAEEKDETAAAAPTKKRAAKAKAAKKRVAKEKAAAEKAAEETAANATKKRAAPASPDDGPTKQKKQKLSKAISSSEEDSEEEDGTERSGTTDESEEEDE